MLQEHTVINWVSKPPLIRKKRWFMHFDHVFQKPPHMQKYKKNICFHEDFFAALQNLKACICFTLPTHFKTTKDKIHTFASFIKTRRDLGEFFQIISWLCKFTLKKSVSGVWGVQCTCRIMRTIAVVVTHNAAVMRFCKAPLVCWCFFLDRKSNVNEDFSLLGC